MFDDAQMEENASHERDKRLRSRKDLLNLFKTCFLQFMFL